MIKQIVCTSRQTARYVIRLMNRVLGYPQQGTETLGGSHYVREVDGVTPFTVRRAADIFVRGNGAAKRWITHFDDALITPTAIDTSTLNAQKRADLKAYIAGTYVDSGTGDTATVEAPADPGLTPDTSTAVALDETGPTDSA